MRVIASSDLRSKRKYLENGGLISARTKSPEETISDALPLAREIGVTRVSNITYLDKLYIPNYTVTLPGTDDSIWVYSGKGPTKASAKAGAFMEAIERYSSLSSTYTGRLIRGSYFELSKSYKKVLHPDEIIEPVRYAFYDDKTILDFVPGSDLLNNEEVLVPAQLVFSRYTANSQVSSPFLYSHTNGLASGNDLEESICHALCEVIERDAVSIADLCASHIPYTILDRIKTSIGGFEPNQIEQFVDDPSFYPEVDIFEMRKIEPVNHLLKKFGDCKIPLLIKDITQREIGVPTFVASSAEWITDDYGFFAKGYGTHPDSRIALVRAITELSQTRAVNIQGSRDDLKRIKYNQGDKVQNRKWQFMLNQARSDDNRADRKIKPFSEVRSYDSVDILDDIQFILSSLRKGGLRRAIIVDLTNRVARVPVIRAIVPGLETFEVAKLFTNEGALIGRRAKHHFKKMMGLD